MAAIAFVHPKPRGEVLKLIAVGRTSDSKRYAVAIAAIAAARALGASVSLQIVGPATTPRERAVRAALGEQITRLGLDEYVTIKDGVTPSEVLSLISQADAAISTTIEGSADKAVFEFPVVHWPSSPGPSARTGPQRTLSKQMAARSSLVRCSGAEADRKRLAECDDAAHDRQAEEPVSSHHGVDRPVDLGDLAVRLANRERPRRRPTHHHAFEDGLAAYGRIGHV
jgi:hypothetical protein